MSIRKLVASIFFSLTFLAGIPDAIGKDKKIVLISGAQSHGSGQHEFRAGNLLLKQCLDQVQGIEAVVVFGGWPEDVSVLDDAAAVFIFSDGGTRHPVIAPEKLRILGRMMDKGVGLGCAHYAVEMPKDKGGAEYLEWIGGYFETYWSVNPHWDADFKSLPSHPVTRGVKPFKLRDEWYYHMRFPDSMKGVTPILTAVPPDRTRGKEGQNDPHGGNPTVFARKGMPEHVMWTTERPDGGRGFGITGGHFHKNWGDENFRKIVLNALLWSAKVEVPLGGVRSTVTADDLKKNLD